MLDSNEMGPYLLHSWWSSFLETVITFDIFREFRNTPLKVNLIKFVSGLEIKLSGYLSILIETLLGPTTLHE